MSAAVSGQCTLRSGSAIPASMIVRASFRSSVWVVCIDIAEVQTAEGKLYLFVGIDRTSKFAVTQLVDKADRRTAWEFLEHLLKAVPYRIHIILTDNGIQFAEQPRNRNTAWSRQMLLTGNDGHVIDEPA